MIGNNLMLVVLVVAGATMVHAVRNRNLGAQMSRGITLSEGGAPPNRNRDINIRLDSAIDDIKTKAMDTCTGDFKDIPGHTMCMRDDQRVTRTGVTSEEREQIVRLHNEARGSVQPPATDLTTLVWNDDLAAVAQKWSKQCVMGHDKERSVPGLGMQVGQNVAGGYRSWQAAIKAWHDEVKMYKFGQDPDSYLGQNGWVKIGHYTQMVQNITHQVGCGFASCRSSKFGRYFVCNYAAAQTRLAVPYTRGPQCSACPNSCKNGLCDCGGRICLNGGSLDADSCVCECPPVYKGDNCSQMNCPSEDPFYCGRDIAAGDCGKYYNVPHMCPFMCGVCTGGKNTNIDVQVGMGESAPPQPIFTSSFGCQYEGKRATPEECKTYGDKGADKAMCASRGGEFGCNECSLYYNVKKDYCPVQCGLCDAACPAEDQFHCSFYPDNFCQDFVNVPEECPYKCNVCKK